MKIMISSLFCTLIVIADAIVLNSSPLDGKIINGLPGIRKIVQYMASLQLAIYEKNNLNELSWKHFCGSAIISSRVLLTSGFCVIYMETETGQNYIYASAVVGTIDLLEDTHKRHSILTAQAHPLLYSTKSQGAKSNYDIGVVLLKKVINPIYGIPIVTNIIKYSAFNEFTISGWGCEHIEDVNVLFKDSCVSTNLNTLVVKTKGMSECLSHYPFLQKTSPQFCASAGQDKRTSWRDMGSPLIQTVRERNQTINYIVGITSGVTGTSNPFLIRFVRIPIKKHKFIQNLMDHVEEIENELKIENNCSTDDPSYKFMEWDGLIYPKKC